MHTGTARPLTAYGRYFHSEFIFDWILLSYAGKPLLFSIFTDVTAPPALMHSLKLPMILSLPERWISFFQSKA